MAANRRVAVKHTAAGVFMFILGMSTIILGGFWYPDTVKDRVDGKLVDMIVIESELDDQFADWKLTQDFGGKVGNVGNPTIKNFYLFNITNLEAVLWGTRKPVLAQCGPYAYEVKGTKFDTKFLKDDDEINFISYKLQEQLIFSPENTGEYDCPCQKDGEDGEDGCKCKWALTDKVTTVNVPYAQLLVNLGKLGLSETHITSRLAFRALSDYKEESLGPFIAQLKRGALSRYLSRLYADLRYNEISTELGTRYPEILTSSIPGTLLSMDARIRAARIPLLVNKAFRELNILGIWAALTGFYETVRRKAAPRVLNGMYERLKSDGTPAMLERMRTKQYHNLVPYELQQTYNRVLSLDTPAALYASFYEVCFDAVPNVLTNLRAKIVNEIKNRGNIVYAQAEINAATQWMKGSVPFDLTNFANIFDGKIRLGFELNANETAGKSPPDGVSQYLLKPTNSFSFLNKENPEGWPLWRSLIEEQDEAEKSKIAKQIVELVGLELIINVNEEQVHWIAAWLKSWITNEITILDRLMHWQTKVNLWGEEGLADKPEAVFYGVNRGLELHDAAVGATFARSASLYLWNATNKYSVLNSEGWYTWEKAIIGHREDQAAFQTLTDAHPDLTMEQVKETVKWLETWQGNKFLVKRARKHWTTATCSENGQYPWRFHQKSKMWITDVTKNKTASPCQQVDLQEHKPGIQGGFEINLDGNPGNMVSDKITQYLWDPTNKYSFLFVPPSPTVYQGINVWRDAVDTSWNVDSARAFLIEQMNEAIRISESDDPVPIATTSAAYITLQQVVTIVKWIESWHSNIILKEEVLQRWTYASCLETESAFDSSSKFVYNLTDCTSGEDLDTIQVVETSAYSPFVTTNTTLISTRTQCDPFDVVYPYVEVATEVQVMKIIDERIALVKPLYMESRGQLYIFPGTIPDDAFYFTYGGTKYSRSALIEQSTNETVVKQMLEEMDLGNGNKFGNVTVTRKVISLASSKMEIEYTITFDDMKGLPVQKLGLQKVGNSLDVEMGIVETKQGGTFDREHIITYYNRTIYTNITRTIDYSCDCVDLEPLVAGLQKGWEPNPGREDAAVTPVSYDGTHYLWDETKEYSFLNEGFNGFRLWLQVAGGSTAARDLIIANAPGSLTVDQVESIASWVASQKTLPWLSYQLRLQWSKVDGKYSQAGIPGLRDIDLEPFRDGYQSGWSLALVTGRSVQRTEYAISDKVSALLWNVSHPKSFLNKDGYRLWLLAGLVRGEECGEFCDKDCMACAADAKKDIAVEFEGGPGIWKDWMITVATWTKYVLTHEILIRDVLRKWMNDTCFDDIPGVLNVISESRENFTNNATMCIANVNVTQDIQTTYNEYYDNYVYDRHSPHYTDDVKQTTVTVQCLQTNISRWVNMTNSTNKTELVDTITTKVITHSEQQITKFSCDAQDLAKNREGINQGFELDPLRELASQRQVPLPVAVEMFNPSSDITFFTQAGFNNWKDSPRDPSLRAAIIEKANHSDFGVDQFEQVLAWLTGWVENPLTKAQFQRLWATRNGDLYSAPLDLDLQQPGIQPGFEVNWDNLPKRSPTTSHAAYLWDPTKPYSFLNPGNITNGEATGFFAWSQLFTGYHPASTHLVRTDDGDYEAKRTFQTGNKSLMYVIGNATNTLPPCQPPDFLDKYFLDVNMSTTMTMGLNIGGHFALVIGGVASRKIVVNADQKTMAAVLRSSDFSHAKNVSANFSVIDVEYLAPPMLNGLGGLNFSLRLVASAAWGPWNSSADFLVVADDSAIGFVADGVVDNSTADGVAKVYSVGRPGDNRTDTITYPCPERNGLSIDLLDQIASWLFSWADNDLLIDLVHEQWAERKYITQEGMGKIAVEPTNLNDQIITGEYFLEHGFPRSESLLGFELDSSLPYSRPQMKQLWNFSNPHSFLHPPGFRWWRYAHRGMAPETGLLPEQRVPRKVSLTALKNIAVSTNTAPDCGANSSNTTVDVFYTRDATSEFTNVAYSSWKWNETSEQAYLDSCANPLSWRNETIFFGNATHNRTYVACYEVAEVCAATCLPDSTGRLVSSVCGGALLEDDVQQCRVDIRFVTNTTIEDFGQSGTHTAYTQTVKTDSWVAQAANGKRWELNRTTFVDIVYHYCPSRNGLNREQITDVAAWVIGWTDHPIVQSSVQQRWWQQSNSSAYDNERGFELHTTYPGESYLSMKVKPGLVTAINADRVEIPAAAAAYLWDVRNEFSFLNYDGMKAWEKAIRHTQDWGSIAMHIPGQYSDGSSGHGTLPSKNGTLMKDDGKAMKVIAKWLESWAVHPFLQYTVQRQWRHGVIKSKTEYRMPTPAPTNSPTAPTNSPTAPTKSPTAAVAAADTNSSSRRLRASTYEHLSPLMKERYWFFDDPQYFDIDPEGDFSNYGRYLERMRPECTDIDLNTPGCQKGFELDPEQLLIPFTAKVNESDPNSNETWISADVGEDVASILWNPADKRSFLNPDGFVAWTEGLKNCSTSNQLGACSDKLVNSSVLKVGSICNVHDECHTGHFCSVHCKSGKCDDTINVCQACTECKQEADGIDGTCLMHCLQSSHVTSHRRSAAETYLKDSLNLHIDQVEHIRDVWLKNWLDNPVLVQSSDFLGAYAGDGVQTVTDLGYLQMGNAGVTTKSFLPSIGHTWLPVQGYESVNFVVKRKYFQPSSQRTTVSGFDAANIDADGDGKMDTNVVTVTGSPGSTKSGEAAQEQVVPPLGFRELSAFTKFGAEGETASHQQFATGMSSLDLHLSKRLIDLFTDQRAVLNATAVDNLLVTKGMYAIQSYIDQPYRTSMECETNAESMMKEFPNFPVGSKFVQDTTEEIRMTDGSIRIVVSRVTGLCTQFPDGYWAGRFFLKNVTTSTVEEKESVHTYMTDLKQYLKYMATKFEYEPRILSRRGGYFTTQTASDLLVTGYRDPLVRRFRDEGVTALIPLQHPHLDLPTATSRRFSLFHNYTRAHAEALGPRKVYAGDKMPYSENLQKFNDFAVWNGKSSIDIWSGETVPVQGTDGSQFAPILSSGLSSAANQLTVWWEEAVRPFVIDYVQDVSRFGIKLRRFTVKNLNRFDLTTDERTPLNLIDLAPSVDGLPLAMSYPHFLSGIVKTIRDGIDGLSPSAIEHETIFDVDPVSGMTMQKKRRWQMNLQIRKTDTWHGDMLVPHCERASREVTANCMLYLPLYWVDERGAIQAEEAYQFKDDIYDEFKQREKIPVASFYGGALLLSVSFILLVLAVRHKAMLQVTPMRKLSRGSNKVAQAPTQQKRTPQKKSAAPQVRGEDKRTPQSRRVTRGGGERAKATGGIARGGGEKAASPGIKRGGGQKANQTSRASPSKIQKGKGTPSKIVKSQGDKQSSRIVRGKGDKTSSKVTRGKGDKTVSFAGTIDV